MHILQLPFQPARPFKVYAQKFNGTPHTPTLAAIGGSITFLIQCHVLLQEQAKIHYGCVDIIGVELENQGGPGTVLSHWEHRVVGVCLCIEMVMIITA